ncbi:unnamed protein product, partial [Mesorhabditis belari]|uniref:Saposin B-type domain-containing protein n=1 Tax=Mesorhabditis belari TaxID=2138241 RepID=A0AAF3FHI7_9BILA
MFVYCIDSYWYPKKSPEKPEVNNICTDYKSANAQVEKVLKNSEMNQLKLHKQKSRRLVKEMLKKVCDKISMADACRFLINSSMKFFDEILVTRSLDKPEKGCKAMLASHLCSESWINYVKLLKKKLKKWQKKATLSNDGFICNQCLWIAGQLHNVFNDDHFQAQILEVIEESICAHLGDAQEECNRLAEQFIQIFFAFISKQFSDSKAFCTKIHLCLNGKNEQSHFEKGFPFVK